MKSNEYDSNKQGIEVIDVINTFDETNSKIFNLEKTMIKPDMSFYTSQIMFTLHDEKLIKGFNSDATHRHKIGSVIHQAFKHILETENREIIFMHVAIDDEGFSIKDTIIADTLQKENEVNLEIKIGSSFNYISDSTYKQIPMEIWRKLDSKKLLDKAIFDDQINKVIKTKWK